MSAVELFHRNDIRSVRVETNFSRQGPYSISFQCSRIQPRGCDPSTIYIHPEIFNIFRKAVEGKAHEDMEPNDCEACVGADMSHCGNRRGYLAECRCEDLNRKIKPYIRNHFENKVIDKILKHGKITQSLRNGKPFQFNLAIFCSGRLLGEEILLFRLLNELHNQKASGTINLFLIDRDEYTPAIRLGDPGLSLNSHKYLHQFLTEICECLPPSLKINGTIFAEADHYTAQAQADARFKHDLLIGADIEGTQRVMDDINSKASAANGQTPLALVRSVREGGPPGSCDIVCGQLTNCSLYLDPPQRRHSPSTQRPSWDVPVAVSASVVVVVAVAVILGLTLSNRRV
ncbi:MAG: hypothetical protein KDK96_09580 [Chlamydiia bacterium]|nr:hypothetical protein [Chlamydiia bacterium]